ncbi:hypothetical protein QE152_g13342 [Popillia japonica]|uniref:Uncharacterized protein n=1 Tax=Popillia japonica TaxID=7064 RepID=A0AAW1LC98_POPJA
MNRHVQSQPYYPDSFYNRHQNDVDPSYAHNFDISNYYPHHNYRRGPLQHPPQEIATVSTLQLSVAITSTQILIPATAHTLESEVVTALEILQVPIHLPLRAKEIEMTIQESGMN